MKKINLALLGFVLLAGCAAAPSPELDYSGHRDKAQSWVGLQRCIQQGNLSPDISALGIRYYASDLGGYAFNRTQLDNLVEEAYRDIPSVNPSYCNSIAAAIAGEKQQIDIHNAQVDRNRQEVQNAVNQINSNRPVVCNTVGTYTMCQ